MNQTNQLKLKTHYKLFFETDNDNERLEAYCDIGRLLASNRPNVANKKDATPMDTDDREEIETVLEALKREHSSRQSSSPASEKFIDQLRQNSSNVVLVVLEKHVHHYNGKESSKKVRIDSEKLSNRKINIKGDGKKICGTQNFAEQRSAYCLGTGFFMGERGSAMNPLRLITAAHVLVPPFNELKNFSEELLFVRNFKVSSKGGNKMTHIITADKKDIYKPTFQHFKKGESLKYELTSTGADWASLEVEGAYGNDLPDAGLVINSNPTMITKGQGVYCLGHGLGLPLKMVYNGKISKGVNVNGDFFECNLDLFSGNSGSPIFDCCTHQVIGMLVRGEEEFLLDGKCIKLVTENGAKRKKTKADSAVEEYGEECQTVTPFAPPALLA
ncbi:MAG: serine protease [Bacteroidota bacterium]